MIKKVSYTFPSKADGLLVSCLAVFSEKEERKGILQLVHGMSEFKERYEPFMEYMAERGFACVIHDHRGHGKSVKAPEDLGYMYGGGADALLQDIDMVNQDIRKRFPGLPLTLFGHSMGSLAVRAYAAAHDDRIDMLVVCGTPCNNVLRPVATAIAAAEKKILGARHKSRLIETLSFGSYAMRFSGEKNRFAWICSDPEVIKAYEESELCGFTFTDDAYLVLFELMKRAYDIKKWKCTKPDMPVLFISGAEDPCMGNVRLFAKAVHAMRYAGYRDVRGKLYPGMRHEILNEKQREQVYHDVYRYVDRKLKLSVKA